MFDDAFFDDDDEEEIDTQKFNRKYDITSVTGIEHILTLRYFKSSPCDDKIFMVAPVLENANSVVPFRLTSVLHKNRWLPLDLANLEKCVHSTLKEELNRNLQKHFENNLMNMNLSDNELKLITVCQSDDGLVDAAVKVSVDRELLNEEELTCNPTLCYVKWPGGMTSIKSSAKTLYDIVQLKLKFSQIINNIDFTDFSEHYPVDWLTVSAKMLKVAFVVTTPEECQRVWQWHHTSGVNREKFTAAEIVRLSALTRELGNNNWEEIALKIGNGRTAYDCYRLSSSAPLDYKCDMDTSAAISLANCFVQHQNYKILAGKLLDYFPQMNSEIATKLFEHQLNPMLRKRNFSVIEDVILFVAYELEKVSISKHDGEKEDVDYDFEEEGEEEDEVFTFIHTCMPWRGDNRLRERHEVLFRPRARPFLPEEDKLLMAAVKQFGPRWHDICKLFNSNKDRRTCAGRYKRLNGMTFEEMGQTTYFITQKLTWNHRLFLVLKRLYSTVVNWSAVDPLQLSQLSLTTPPTDLQLNKYIRSFGKTLIENAFDRLLTYCYENMEYESNFHRYFDRRCFDMKLPISWASALHHREIPLKPLESIENPTKFEIRIYRHYEKFSSRHVKKGCSRVRVPTAEQLCQYDEISRIIYDYHKQATEPSPSVQVKVEMVQQEELKAENSEDSTDSDYYPSEADSCTTEDDFTSDDEQVEMNLKFITEELRELKPMKLDLDAAVIKDCGISVKRDLDGIVKRDLEAVVKNHLDAIGKLDSEIFAKTNFDTNFKRELETNVEQGIVKKEDNVVKENINQGNIFNKSVLGRKRGPTKGRIAQVRKNAALARWNKKRSAESESAQHMQSIETNKVTFDFDNVKKELDTGNCKKRLRIALGLQHDHNYL